MSAVVSQAAAVDSGTSSAGDSGRTSPAEGASGRTSPVDRSWWWRRRGSHPKGGDAPAEPGAWSAWASQAAAAGEAAADGADEDDDAAAAEETRAAVPRHSEPLVRALWSAAHRVVAPRTLLAHLKTVSPAFRECVTHFDLRGASTRVAVAVDDAPSDARLMHRALDAFAAAGVTATIFVVANFCRDAARRATLERAVREGHELGNHLCDDASAARLSRDAFDDALRSCDDLIASLDPAWPGRRFKWFRPPQGYMAAWMREPLAALGCALSFFLLAHPLLSRYTPVLADVFPLDTEVRSVDWLVSFCVENAKPGSILLLHAPDVRTAPSGKVHERQNNVDVFARLLPQLKIAAEVGTLSDLAAESAELVELDDELAAAPAPADAPPG